MKYTEIRTLITLSLHHQVYGYERADGVGRSGDLVIQGFVRGTAAALLPVIICAGVLYVLVSYWTNLKVTSMGQVQVAA